MKLWHLWLVVVACAPLSAQAGQRLAVFNRLDGVGDWVLVAVVVTALASLGVIWKSLLKLIPKFRAWQSPRRRQQYLKLLYLPRVRELAARKKVPQSFLWRFLEGWSARGSLLGDQSQVFIWLEQKSNDFLFLKSHLKSVSRKYPHVSRLREEASNAMDCDDFDLALACLLEARQRMDAQDAQRRVSEVIENAENTSELAALTKLTPDPAQYRLAAKLFQKSAHFVVAIEDLSRRYQLSQAKALLDLGREFNDNGALFDAIAIYRNLLDDINQTLASPGHQERRSKLMATYETIARDRNGTMHAQERIATYQEAMRQNSEERLELDWAIASSHYGLALQHLGERENNKKHLNEAVRNYQGALIIFSKYNRGQDWAFIQTHLGMTQLNLGKQEKDAAVMEDAVVSLRRALKVYTRNRQPLNWAAVYNFVGVALTALGEREKIAMRFKEALASFYDAQKVRTKEGVPLDWAVTEKNIGHALRLLGERNRDEEVLLEAVDAYRGALKVLLEVSPHFAREARGYISRTKKKIRQLHADNNGEILTTGLSTLTLSTTTNSVKH